MLYRNASFIPILALVMFLGVSAVAQADPPRPGEDPPEGSSLNETLSFNNLGTVMSGKNDPKEADDLEDGVGDENPGDEVDDPEENDDGVDDALKQHPVARALAGFFLAKTSYDDVNMLYDEIVSLHEAGNGFGTITKAYFFADKFDPPLTPQELLDKAHGTGWGNVLKEGNIQPGSVGNGGVNSNRPEFAGRPDKDNPEKDGPPGQVKKENEADSVSASMSGLVGPGGNNGNGNNKGSNGRADERGGGNGNNGNNGNNGQDNGNDKARGNK